MDKPKSAAGSDRAIGPPPRNGERFLAMSFQRMDAFPFLSPTGLRTVLCIPHKNGSQKYDRLCPRRCLAARQFVAVTVSHSWVLPKLVCGFFLFCK
mmetsp:Transcript_4973/g.9063  ORF Transcript_4973/g.9063 Transcript_4973/m.9063 type:complete len:96 (+) Transcript_4973:135-422(+)